MQLKLAALALASATAVFAAEDAAADFSLPPSSILGVLATAVPTSVLGELDNLSAISAWAYGLASSIENGQTPGWVASLPPSVKSYLYTAYVTDTAAMGSATSAMSAASTGGASTSPATATVTSVSSSSSSASGSSESSAATSATGSAASAVSSAESAVSSALSSAASAASSAAKGSSSTSTGGAPAATGALAVGLTGAMGVLGLALAL